MTSKIRKLIEAARQWGFDAGGPLSAAEAELKELEAKVNAASWVHDHAAELAEQYSKHAERDRADAELLEAVLSAQKGKRTWRDCVDALERWAAAKGGDK